MKLNLSVSFHGLLLVAQATARIAPVYLTSSINPVTDDYPQKSSLSPTHARLVIAHRFGLSEFHRLSPWTDELLRALNVFGGEHKHISGGSKERRLKAILMLEGVQDAEDIIPSVSGGPRPAFDIDNPPTADASNVLLRDMSTQALSLQQQLESYEPSAAAVLGKELKMVKTAARSLNATYFAAIGDYVFVQARAPEEILSVHGPSGQKYKDVVSASRLAIQSLLEQAVGSLDLALLIMPPQPSGIFKRASGSYGSYSMPTRRQEVPESDADAGRPNDNSATLGSGYNDSSGIAAIAPAPERPLPPTSQQDDNEPGQSPPDGDAPERPSPPGEGQPPPNEEPPRNRTAPQGILPSCFTSEAICISSTNSCSGHGTCIEKYKFEEGDHKSACYMCSCRPDVENRDGGKKKTTRWAGPACQKKDVSIPFWFLGGVTIFFVLVISWGIGLLIQMGSEDLPSVIGAGVAGAKPSR